MNRAFVVSLCLVAIVCHNCHPRKGDASGALGEKLTGTDLHGDPLPSGAVLRLGTVRFRHEGEALSVGFSPDGKQLAAASRDVIYVWEAATGKLVRKLSSFGPTVSYLEFSPDGELLASANSDEQIRLWQISTGRLLRTLPGSCFRLRCRRPVAFSPDNKRLAIVALGPSRPPLATTISMIELASGVEVVALQGVKPGVSTIAFSPDGQRLAVGRLNPAIQIWNAATGRLEREYGPSSVAPHALAFSRGGDAIAWATKDKIVLLQASTGKEIGAIQAKMDVVVSLDFTEAGKSLVSTSQDGKVRVWDVARLQQRIELDARMWMIRSGALSCDNRTVAAGTIYNTIRLWDIGRARELFEQYNGHDASVNCVAYSPDGRTLVSAADNNELFLWDAEKGKLQARLKANSTHSVSFSPDGLRFATAERDVNRVRVWDARIGKCLVDLQCKGEKVISVGYSRDGKTLISGHSSRERGSVRVWDAVNGVHRGTIDTGAFLCMALASDNKFVALGTETGSVNVWDLDTQKAKHVLSGHRLSVEAVAFSPDGKLIASGGRDQTMIVWSAFTGEKIVAVKHKRPISALTFSPDSRLVASGTGLTHFPVKFAGPLRIHLWDPVTGKEIGGFEGHESFVTSLAFHPNAKNLASGLRNTTILIWDLPNFADATK